MHYQQKINQKLCIEPKKEEERIICLKKRSLYATIYRNNQYFIFFGHSRNIIFAVCTAGEIYNEKNFRFGFGFRHLA